MANENIVSGKKYKVLQNGVWKLFSFFTKASDVEFDDGMNAEEKIQFIEENGVGIELTLAEYEALSEEEKNNGTYWINDSNEPMSDGSRFLKTTDVVDSLDSTDSTAPLSANMGRYINAVLDNILTDMLPTITEFEVTTGTGSGKGYAYIPIDSSFTRAVVTNLNREDYFVSNVSKFGTDKLALTVIHRTDGSWADNITIKGTMILYKEY